MVQQVNYFACLSWFQVDARDGGLMGKVEDTIP